MAVITIWCLYMSRIFQFFSCKSCDVCLFLFLDSVLGVLVLVCWPSSSLCLPHRACLTVPASLCLPHRVCLTVSDSLTL